MKRQFLFIFSALMVGLPALAVADVDALMKGCNDCHGDNGVSQWSDVPSIAGLPEFVHSDALYIFKDGEDFASLRKQGIELLKVFHSQVKPQKIVGVEVPFSVKIPGP